MAGQEHICRGLWITLEMTTEKPTLLIRLEPTTKAALRKAARAERRSMAIMAGLLIEEGLQRRAPEPKKKPRA
jgi:hypothetical protein